MSPLHLSRKEWELGLLLGWLLRIYIYIYNIKFRNLNKKYIYIIWHFSLMTVITPRLTALAL